MVKDKLSTRIFLFVLSAVLIYGCYKIVSPFIEPIFYAIVLGIVVWPINLWIRRYLKGRNRSALATTFLALAGTILPIVLLQQTITREIRSAYRALGPNATARSWPPRVQEALDTAIEWSAPKIGVTPEEIHQRINTGLGELASKIASGIPQVLGTLASTIASAFIIFFTLFFFLRDASHAVNSVKRYLPVKPRIVDRLISSTSDSIIANVYGMIGVAAIQGILSAAGYTLTGVRAPVLWGLVTGICSVIPIVGGTIIWVPITLILGLSGDWGKAALLAGWCTLIVGSSDNLVRPFIVSGRSNLNGFLIFFALLGGLQVFGFAGLFVGPLLITLTATALNLLDEEMSGTDIEVPGPEEQAVTIEESRG